MNNKNDLKILYERIFDGMKKKNFNHKEVSEICGYSRYWLWQKRKYLHNISKIQLRKVCRVIDIPIDVITQDLNVCNGISETLCWRCDKYNGQCSWSREFKPVKGWYAKPTKIKYSNYFTNSYLVIDCPEYTKSIGSKRIEIL